MKKEDLQKALYNTTDLLYDLIKLREKVTALNEKLEELRRLQDDAKLQ